MRKIFIYSILIIVAATIFSSCKTLKERKRTKNVLTITQLYDSIQSTRLQYESLSAKFSVKYKATSKVFNLKGNLRVLKDSIIWVSLSPGLGIEAVRLMCTKDSVFLLDKINKSITSGKYEYLNRLWKIDVDYNSLQSIITDQFFIYPAVINEKQEFSTNFSLKQDSSKLSVYRKTGNSVENLIKFGMGSYIVQDYLINDVPNVRSLAVSYLPGSFNDIKNFPGTINISSTNAGKSLSIELNYTKAVLNESLSFPFTVPSSYRVVNH